MIRIIVVEDDYHLNGLIKKVLEKDYIVDSVYNPVRALEVMSNNAYDLIISDIMMPEMSGFDVAEIIRQESLATHIIFVTSKRELVYSSFEYSPFYFICKN